MYILKLYNTLFDLLFPEHCIGCGKFGVPLCIKCISFIPKSGSTELDYAHAIFSYKHPYISNLIWEMKYSGNRQIAKLFGRYIAEMLTQEITDNQYFTATYILIPVPLSQKKQRIRGYNQAAWIAESAMTFLDPSIKKRIIYKPDLIARNHREISQARTKHRTERLSQIEGSFYISKKHKHFLKDKNVILIDDVTTSGATIAQMEEVFRQAGVKQMVAYTVAH